MSYIKDIYCIEKDSYTLMIYFEYYYSCQTHEDPSYEQLDICKVEFISNDESGNSTTKDITSFYNEFVNDTFDKEIINYIKEN